MRRFRRRRRGEAPELDITPFMNLMVILVPFLLVTAVFSRLAVLELTLPEAGGAPSPAKPPPMVIGLAADGTLSLQGGGLGRHHLAPRAGAPDLAALRRLLAEAKAVHPSLRAVTLRIHPQRDYASVVALMDAVRRLPTAQGAAELFPDIALAEWEGGT